MTRCAYCHEKIKSLPFHCKRCNKFFCDEHRLPEDHKCAGLKKGNIFRNLNRPNIDKIVERHPSNTSKKEERRINKESSSKINKTKNNISKKPNNALKKTFIILLLVLLISLISIYILSQQEKTIVKFKNVTKAKTVTHSKEKPISFSEYLSEDFKPSNEEIVLQGYLKRKIDWKKKDLGIHVYSIIDEKNNSIPLSGDISLIQKFIPEVGKTDSILSVRGTFEESYDGLEFHVNNITKNDNITRKKQTFKEVKKVQEVIPVNKTVAKYPLLKNLVDTLFNRGISCEYKTTYYECSENESLSCSIYITKEKISECGCPEGHIIKNNTCVPVCKDGTIYNKCSEDKPLFCSTHGLEENPSKCGCPKNMRIYKGECIQKIACDDGTLSPECSEEKNKQCLNGTFIFNPNKCGCPENYVAKNDTCMPACKDGTIYNECSEDKPLFCDDGKLINKASTCGCPTNYIKDDGSCVSKYETGAKTIELEYVLDGHTRKIEFVVYNGINDYVANISRSISYYNDSPTTKDFVLKNIDNGLQLEYIQPLVKKIESRASDKSEKAKIAISLVQNIPYDMASSIGIIIKGRYAYQVLYEQKGVCGEKSELLALLLRELGFGVVLFHYEEENHMALGIKCPEKYGYLDTEYCFVETTQPSIITDSDLEYMGVGKLESKPEIINLSEGSKLENVKEEYYDARDWNSIQDMIDYSD